MTQPKNSTLASLLAEGAALQRDGADLESNYQIAMNRLKAHQQKMQSLSSIVRELTIGELEALLLPVIQGKPEWNLNGLIVQAVPVNDDWWKVFFYTQLADEVIQFDPQSSPPGFYWSFDPAHRIAIEQRSIGAGEFVRWGEQLPKINPKGGILGCLLVNPITGDSQITLDRKVAFPEPERFAFPEPQRPTPAPTPAPVAPGEAPTPTDATADTQAS